MKILSPKMKTIASALLLFTIAASRSFAQGNAETNAEALNFSHEIESKISDFDTNAWNVATNESIFDSQKEIDRVMGGAQNSIESAIVTLEFSQGSIDRNVRTILWFEILAALDRHAGKIPGSQIGYLPAPPGYKGKVGMDGIEMPDTNDIVDYKIYVAAIRARRKNNTDAIFQNMLKTENEWEATPCSEKFFRSSYTSEADKQEFENLVDHSKLSVQRKKALKEAVVAAK